ncbi:MAG: hypothetical protein Q9M92_12875 [Enterobacterales bacterium]|nr:hypothetical protein [Enterobacterales bacterium]
MQTFIRALANEENFLLFEKDHGEMSFLSHNKDAFYISYYKENEEIEVMWISNVGSPNQLVLGFNSSNSFTPEMARKLSVVIINYLKVDLNTYLFPVDPNAEIKKTMDRQESGSALLE